MSSIILDLSQNEIKQMPDSNFSSYTIFLNLRSLLFVADFFISIHSNPQTLALSNSKTLQL